MRDIEEEAGQAYVRHFAAEPDLVASAPGRVNLIGEHTDYNGGFVLPCAIDRRVAMAIGHEGSSVYSANYDSAEPLGGDRTHTWADYPRGVVWALREAGHEIPAFSAAFAGNVPLGSGLSSSAAIECAAAVGLDALLHLDIDRRDLARITQRAENGYLGVNSGIMDQYASLLCRKGAALFIDCRSLEAESVPLDLEAAGLSLVVCDTRVERTLAGTGYNERRATCEEAARELGVSELRDATAGDLDRLDGIVLKRARHVITENIRVVEAVEALRRNDFAAFGRLMYASHASLRDDYEVSIPQLDTFVEVARAVGALGARLTGAGFGGCAIALIDSGSVDALSAAVMREFQTQGFGQPDFYSFVPADGAEVVL